MSMPLQSSSLASTSTLTGWQRLLGWLTQSHRQRYISQPADLLQQDDAWFWQLSDLACDIASVCSLQQLPDLLAPLQAGLRHQAALASNATEGLLQALVLPDDHHEYQWQPLVAGFRAPVRDCKRLLRQPEQWLDPQQQLMPLYIAANTAEYSREVPVHADNEQDERNPQPNAWLLIRLPQVSQRQQWLLRQGVNAISERLQQGLAGWYRQHQRLQQAIAEERRCHAAELHDSLAQQLAYTRMQSARLAKQLEVDSAVAPQAQSLAQELEQQCHFAYRQTRELITTARFTTSPATLVQSLEHLIEEFEQRSALVFELDVRIDPARLGLNDQQTTQLAFVVRESVCNLVRHSHASQAWIRLQLDQTNGQQLICQIDDNGKGIRGKARSDSFGIQIMQERAKRIGASLSLSPRHDSGTRVELTLPLE